MKKIMSMTGIGLVAFTLLMSSCVSKKKYVAAQNTIEQYRTDSARMAQEAATQQQNYTTLEEKHRSLQSEYDSTKNAYETRWAGIESYYTEQKSNAEQLHQSIHQALSSSEVIDPNSIVSSNGRVYVTLDDNIFSGTALNSKGREAIGQFADVIKSKENVTVDVVSGDSYAAYWNKSGGDSSRMNSMNNDATGNVSQTTGDDDDDNDVATTTTTTRKTTTTRPRSSTATRSKATTSRASTAKKSTYTKSRSESGRSMAFKSKSKSKSSTGSSWNSKVAKATSIAKELHKKGVYNVGLMIPGQSATGTSGTSENNNKFQLIVTPKGERYYEMIEKKNANASGAPTSMK